MRKTILIKLKEIIQDILKVDQLAVELHPNTSLTIDLNMTSLDLLSLLMKCEDTFQIEFDPDKVSIKTFQSIETLVEMIESHL